MKKCVMCVVAVLVCVVNPMVFMVGCGSIGPDYGCGTPPKFNPEYTSADMQQELLNAPKVHVIELDDGSSLEVTFTIDDQSFAALHSLHKLDSVQQPAMQWFKTAHACLFLPPSARISFAGTLTLKRMNGGDQEPEVLVEGMPLKAEHTFYENYSEQLYAPTQLRLISDGFGYYKGEELGDGEWMAFNVSFETMTGRGKDLEIMGAQLIKTLADGSEESWNSKVSMQGAF